jgi:hypothetical protein
MCTENVHSILLRTRPNNEPSIYITNKQTQLPESASELHRPSYRRLSVKLVPTFADREVSRSQRGGSPYGRNLGFLDRSRYFFFQAAPQLYSRG